MAFLRNRFGAAFRSFAADANSARGYHSESQSNSGDALYPAEHEGFWEKVKNAFRPEEREQREERAALQEDE